MNIYTATRSELESLDVTELKALIKSNYLGSVSTKVKSKLVDYIVEQVEKRSVDVFRNHT
jgi:hypothetical protein